MKHYSKLTVLKIIPILAYASYYFVNKPFIIIAMRRILFFLMVTAFLCSSFNMYKMGHWDILKGIERKAKYLPQSSSFESKMKFSKAVQRLEGKKIKLKGYFVQGKGWGAQNKTMLTFCRYPNPKVGQGGSNLDEMVSFENAHDFPIDCNKLYHIEGVLRLNAIDRFELPYQLEEVKCQNCKD